MEGEKKGDAGKNEKLRKPQLSGPTKVHCHRWTRDFIMKNTKTILPEKNSYLASLIRAFGRRYHIYKLVIK